MGILVITWNFPPRRGGIEYLMENLVTELKKKTTVSVITAHTNSQYSSSSIFRSPWPGLLPFAVYALCRGARLLFRDPGKKSYSAEAR